MFEQTLYNKANSECKVKNKFETVRESYNRDLTKLRKKYSRVLAALALNYGDIVDSRAVR